MHNIMGANLRCRTLDRCDGRLQQVLWCRPEEAERQVQAVETDPTDVAGACRERHRPDGIHDPGDLDRSLGGQRHTDEQASSV